MRAAQRTQQREWMAAYYGGDDALRGQHVPESGGWAVRDVVGPVHANQPVPAPRHKPRVTAVGAAIQPIDTLVSTTIRGKPPHNINGEDAGGMIAQVWAMSSSTARCRDDGSEG